MKPLALSFTFLTLASAITTNTKKVDYDGWTVHRINVSSNGARLSELITKLELQTWKGHPETSKIVDVAVSPAALQDFQSSTQEWDTKLMHLNLGESIAVEADFPVYAAKSGAHVSRNTAPDSTWFSAYHSLADHMQWITDLAAAFPKNSEVFSAGKSNEGRDLTGIHIWGNGGKGSRAGIVWHATVHAREWITTMVVEYVAYQLLTASDAAAYRDKYDFYIIPVANPDGFFYTQTSDRMWRKNRQSTPSESCVGRDINRNWPHKSWSQPGGASDSPCEQDYRGLSAGDGVETKALKAHLDSIAAGKGVQLYMDIHAYSQLWMYPYGYTCSGTVPDVAEYKKLADGAVAVVKAVHNTTFEAGPICSTIYEASGNSVDYAFDNAGAKYSMTVELRDTGKYGFVLPAAEILPSGEEIWAGLVYLLKNM
ncbi:Peptidase M14 carboxypeptidase A [Macrophomina phaseolina MS6]|uniref:Carboxypeptidase M14A n=1 Tax=Macrophomina phaseolina (strain MS6) TaxID=1126212 RepID=K2RGL4_MACPH|nr:Peptidase M14 carboxypeptidase A [Macrophomina phaseolina MS6]